MLGVSWRIAKASIRVLCAHRCLLRMPALSVAAAAAVACATAGVLWLTGLPGIVKLAVLAAAAAGVPAVWGICDGALSAGAHAALTGTSPPMSAAAGKARSAWPRLAVWGIVSAAVGGVLRATASVARQADGAAGVAGRVGVVAAAAGWRLSSYLVVPVMVLEGRGPFGAYRRSAGIFRTMWGETATLAAGVGTAAAVLAVVGCVPWLVAARLAGVGSALAQTALLAAAGWAVVVAVVARAVGIVTQTVLYVFAVAGAGCAGFDERDLVEAVAVNEECD